MKITSEALDNLGISLSELKSLIESQEWFHTIDLGSGIITPGRDPSYKKLKLLGIPESLENKTVLDIGAYDGFFSFACEERGAKRVVASDHFCWTWPGSSAKNNCLLLKALLNSNVELLEVPVEHLSGDSVGVFDVVLFLGVLYHSPDPLLYLRHVKSVTREMLILETLVDSCDSDEPMAVFYPPGTMNNDSSNFWGPNHLCVIEMLKRVGFRHVEFYSMWDLNTRQKLFNESCQEVNERIKTGRMVFHAYV